MPLEPETRYKGVLEQCVGAVFEGYPSVEEIIVCDRSVDTNITEPYNAVFSRRV